MEFTFNSTYENSKFHQSNSNSKYNSKKFAKFQNFQFLKSISSNLCPESPISMQLVDRRWSCLIPERLTPSNNESFCVLTSTESSQCQYGQTRSLLLPDQITRSIKLYFRIHFRFISFTSQQQQRPVLSWCDVSLVEPWTFCYSSAKMDGNGKSREDGPRRGLVHWFSTPLSQSLTQTSYTQ